MRRLLLFILLIISHNFCFAQKRDSLWGAYKNQTDTSKIKTLQIIAWRYVESKPDTAMILAEEELKLAKESTNGKAKKWIANAFNLIGVLFLHKSNYPKALEHYLKALKICEETKDKKGVGRISINIGNVYKDMFDDTKALTYY